MSRDTVGCHNLGRKKVLESSEVVILLKGTGQLLATKNDLVPMFSVEAERLPL